MCGISGFNWLDKSKIKMMNNSMLNRGPDNQGYYCNEDVSLGHCRLSIIDLSEAGNQPMISSDTNYIIVYNGEVYNYKELDKEYGVKRSLALEFGKKYKTQFNKKNIAINIMNLFNSR